jgi:hypothetical protein
MDASIDCPIQYFDVNRGRAVARTSGRHSAGCTEIRNSDAKTMSTSRTIDEVMRDMNAWAMAEGIAFDGDPWSIPPVEGSILGISPTCEAEARIARLRARRQARGESAKRASEQARTAQDKSRTDNGEQCRQTATEDQRAHLPVNEEPKEEVPY